MKASGKFKIPSKIGEAADMLFTLRAKRLKAQKLVEAMEEQESLLKTHLINKLPKSEASGVAGKLARVSVNTDKIPQVQDWNKFYGYIKKTGAFELLGKRIKKEAIEERLDAGEKIPGLGTFTVVSLSLNKI